MKGLVREGHHRGRGNGKTNIGGGKDVGKKKQSLRTKCLGGTDRVSDTGALSCYGVGRPSCGKKRKSDLQSHMIHERE